MEDTTIKLTTYSCPSCGYRQDFDPNDPSLVALHFPGLPLGVCPACYSGKNPQRRVIQGQQMAREMDQGKLVSCVVKGQRTIQTEDVPDGQGGLRKRNPSEVAQALAEAQQVLAHLKALEHQP